MATRLSAIKGRLFGGDRRGDVIVDRSVYDRFTRTLRELVVIVRVAVVGDGGCCCCWIEFEFENPDDEDEARMRLLSMFGCVIDLCWNGGKYLTVPGSKCDLSVDDEAEVEDDDAADDVVVDDDDGSGCCCPCSLNL